MLLQTASATPIPLFKTLSREECESVLLRNNVGRIAFSVHDRVSIVPIHYVFVNGWIYGRTAAAGKLRQILRNRRIAFEVDEFSELFDWRSVVVHGPLYLIHPDATERSRSIYRTAISALRRLIPDALAETDPVPFRDQLFRVRALDVTGRASSSVGGQRLFPGASEAQQVESVRPDDDTRLADEVESAIASLDVPENADVHVEAFDGVVVLSGTVETFRDRQSIEAAVLEIPLVTAVVQGLETAAPLRQEPLPSELASAAINELRRGRNVLTDGLKIVIEHGWLRLEGFIGSQRQRDDVVRRLRSIRGARGVIDRTRLTSREN